MRGKRIINRLTGVSLIIALLSYGMSSCSTSECFDNQNSLPLAGFYSSSERPQAISIDSISILGVGAPGDSILQDSVRSLSQVYLPFRIDQNSTTYEIRYLFGAAGVMRLKDEITFNYDIVPMFVSTACGAVYYYDMKNIEYTQNLIDSVVCPKGVITNENIENLKIYFKTGEED